jgi:hypothetical protein
MTRAIDVVTWIGVGNGTEHGTERRYEHGTEHGTLKFVTLRQGYWTACGVRAVLKLTSRYARRDRVKTMYVAERTWGCAGVKSGTEALTLSRTVLGVTSVGTAVR